MTVVINLAPQLSPKQEPDCGALSFHICFQLSPEGREAESQWEEDACGEVGLAAYPLCSVRELTLQFNSPRTEFQLGMPL